MRPTIPYIDNLDELTMACPKYEVTSNDHVLVRGVIDEARNSGLHLVRFHCDQDQYRTLAINPDSLVATMKKRPPEPNEGCLLVSKESGEIFQKYAARWHGVPATDETSYTWETLYRVFGPFRVFESSREIK